MCERVVNGAALVNGGVRMAALDEEGDGEETAVLIVVCAGEGERSVGGEL